MVVNPSLKYSVPNAGDFNAMQANARALCNAYLTKYPELRDGFTTILAHAVDPSGRDVVGIVPLKAYQTDRQPAPFPTGIAAMDPAIPLRLRPATAVPPTAPVVAGNAPAANVPAGNVPAGNVPAAGASAVKTPGPRVPATGAATTTTAPAARTVAAHVPAVSQPPAALIHR